VTSATAQGSIKDNFQKFIFNLYKLTSVRLDKQISLLVLTLWLVSCNGPRNIYSASPFVSPVPLTKGATAIEANYFTHTREQMCQTAFRGIMIIVSGLIFLTC
jgi:hypothetical protein